MNPENYEIKTAHVNYVFMGNVELPMCKRCGSLVGDMDIHDTDHDNRAAVAQNARDAYSKAHDYTPYGR